jgi:hypothetical protein
MQPEWWSEIVSNCCKSGKIDMGGQGLGIDHLELILTVLRARGSVEVANCGGVMSLLELGAYLRSMNA